MITIVTPTYNAADHIENCLLSVVNQRYQNKEHLIVDGASSDGTLVIVKKLASKYPHIRLISERDNGIYDAMNKGITHANGDWIYFLGADDTLNNDTVLDEVFSTPDIHKFDLVYGNVEWGDTGKLYDGEFTLPKLMLQNICHQAIFYKKTLFSTIGRFDLKYKIWADYLFNITAFTSNNTNIKYLDLVVAKFAFNGASSKAVVDTSFLQDRQLIYRDRFPADYVEFYNRIDNLTVESKREVVELNQQLIALNQQLTALNQQLVMSDQELLACGQQLAERNRQLLESERIFNIKLGEIDNLEHSLASTRQSLSWRITKPVRLIADIFKFGLSAVRRRY
jgi:glycosyltransferase involved in cell wall biosynthesis